MNKIMMEVRTDGGRMPDFGVSLLLAGGAGGGDWVG